jgi:hypothetical protein
MQPRRQARLFANDDLLRDPAVDSLSAEIAEAGADASGVDPDDASCTSSASEAKMEALDEAISDMDYLRSRMRASNYVGATTWIRYAAECPHE